MSDTPTADKTDSCSESCSCCSENLIDDTEAEMDSAIAELDRATKLLKTIVDRLPQGRPSLNIDIATILPGPDVSGARFGQALLSALEKNLIAPPPTPADVTPPPSQNGHTN